MFEKVMTWLQNLRTARASASNKNESASGTKSGTEGRKIIFIGTKGAGKSQMAFCFAHFLHRGGRVPSLAELDILSTVVLDAIREPRKVAGTIIEDGTVDCLYAAALDGNRIGWFDSEGETLEEIDQRIMMQREPSDLEKECRDAAGIIVAIEPRDLAASDVDTTMQVLTRYLQKGRRDRVIAIAFTKSDWYGCVPMERCRLIDSEAQEKVFRAAHSPLDTDLESRWATLLRELSKDYDPYFGALKRWILERSVILWKHLLTAEVGYLNAYFTAALPDDPYYSDHGFKVGQPNRFRGTGMLHLFGDMLDAIVKLKVGVPAESIRAKLRWLHIVVLAAFVVVLGLWLTIRFRASDSYASVNRELQRAEKLMEDYEPKRALFPKDFQEHHNLWEKFDSIRNPTVRKDLTRYLMAIRSQRFYKNLTTTLSDHKLDLSGLIGQIGQSVAIETSPYAWESEAARSEGDDNLGKAKASLAQFFRNLKLAGDKPHSSFAEREALYEEIVKSTNSFWDSFGLNLPDGQLQPRAEFQKALQARVRKHVEATLRESDAGVFVFFWPFIKTLKKQASRLPWIQEPEPWNATLQGALVNAKSSIQPTLSFLGPHFDKVSDRQKTFTLELAKEPKVLTLPPQSGFAWNTIALDQEVKSISTFVNTGADQPVVVRFGQRPGTWLPLVLVELASGDSRVYSDPRPTEWGKEGAKRIQGLFSAAIPDVDLLIREMLVQPAK